MNSNFSAPRQIGSGFEASAELGPIERRPRGRQRRSSTYPQAFLVNLPRCAIAEALVLAFRVVKFQPGANTGLGFGHSRISIEVDLLIFEAAPQPLDEDVVHTPALAVHADHDPLPFQGTGEVVASELAALVGINDLRPAIA